MDVYKIFDKPSAPSGHIPRNILQAGRNWMAPINWRERERQRKREREKETRREKEIETEREREKESEREGEG